MVLFGKGSKRTPRYDVHNATREFIDRCFDEGLAQTSDKRFAEQSLRKVAYYFVSSHIPAFQRTRKALDENAADRHAMNMSVWGFIRGIESGRFGWSHKKTSDGFEQLLFRDGEEWAVLETTNAHIQAEKASRAIRFANLMKKLFG